jgi:hypothetical protein
MTDEYTLEEARATLGALLHVAPDALRLPLSEDDLETAHAVGVHVKSATEGLLDFPTEIDGIPAYWCWQVGEPGIEWWHPQDTGFAGRRRIQ